MPLTKTATAIKKWNIKMVSKLRHDDIKVYVDSESVKKSDLHKSGQSALVQNLNKHFNYSAFMKQATNGSKVALESLSILYPLKAKVSQYNIFNSILSNTSMKSSDSSDSSNSDFEQNINNSRKRRRKKKTKTAAIVESIYYKIPQLDGVFKHFYRCDSFDPNNAMKNGYNLNKAILKICELRNMDSSLLSRFVREISILDTFPCVLEEIDGFGISNAWETLQVQHTKNGLDVFVPVIVKGKQNNNKSKKYTVEITKIDKAVNYTITCFIILETNSIYTPF
eukprot:539608_1